MTLPRSTEVDLVHAEAVAYAVALVREAGAAILAHREARFHPDVKADRSPVTAADRAADAILVAGLLERFPKEAVLSEEAGWSGPVDAEVVWIIDPLDGTEAFIDPSIPGFAVQVARGVREPDGTVTLELGIVYDPERDVLWCAEKATHEVWRSGGGEAPIRVEPRVWAGGIPRLLTSKRVDPEVRDQMLQHGFRDAGVRRSVGIKIAALLMGEAEAYLSTHGLAPWDLAAPQVLLEAAGGVVTDLAGVAPRYRWDALVTLGKTRRMEPDEVHGYVFSVGIPHNHVINAVHNAAP